MAATFLLGAAPASADVQANRFIRYNSSLCLDGFKDRGAYFYACNGGDFQRWIWNNDPNVRTPLRSAGEHYGGYAWCLQEAGTAVSFAVCDARATAQRWRVAFPSNGGLPFVVSNNGNCLYQSGPRPDWGYYARLKDCDYVGINGRFRIN